jgi:hypothetical protein
VACSATGIDCIDARWSVVYGGGACLGTSAADCCARYVLTCSGAKHKLTGRLQACPIPANWTFPVLRIMIRRSGGGLTLLLLALVLGCHSQGEGPARAILCRSG